MSGRDHDDQTEREWRIWLERFERDFNASRRRTMETVAQMRRDTAIERAALEAERVALTLRFQQLTKTVRGNRFEHCTITQTIYTGIGDTSLVKAPETCKDYPLVCYHLNGTDREARRARRVVRYRAACHLMRGASIGSILALVVFYTGMPLFVAVPIAMVLWNIYWKDKDGSIERDPPVPEARLLPKDTTP